MSKVLDSIPDEIILVIFEEMPAKDIIHLSSTCHRLNHLMKTSSVVQLILDLATFGYVLSPKWKENSKGRTPQELAQSFFKVMSRWERFDYTAKLRFQYGSWSARVKDRVAVCMSNNLQLHHFDRMRHLAQPRTLNDPTPSGRSRSDITPWTRYSLPKMPSIFDWDVTQDLIIYRNTLTESLHVNQLSTHLPHPLTFSPKIELDFTALSISIADELVIVTDADGAELLVVNWKTHKKVLGPIANVAYGYFGMLDADTLMILMKDDSRFWLEVFVMSTPTRRLQLLLPFSTKPESMGSYMNTGSSLNPDVVNAKSYYIHDPSSDRMLVLNFRTWNTYRIVISSHRVLDIIKSSNDDFKTLSWSHWSPNATRWFETSSWGQIPSSFSTQGASVYFSFPTRDFLERNRMSSNFPDSSGVIFCDFNPRHVRRYLSTVSQSPYPTHHLEGGSNQEQSSQSWHCEFNPQHIVTEEWVLRSDSFTEDVHCRLPFRATLHHFSEQGSMCPIMDYSPIGLFLLKGDMCIYYFDENSDGKTEESL